LRYFTLQTLQLHFFPERRFPESFIEVSIMKNQMYLLVFFTICALQAVVRLLVKTVLEDSDQPDKLCTIEAHTLELLSLLVHDLAEQNMIAMIWARCSESRRRLKQVLGCLIMLQKTPEGKNTCGRINNPFRRQLIQLEKLIGMVIIVFPIN
jgi:hypothetical protein